MTKIQHFPKEGVTSGPYSPAVEIENFVYISGQGTYNPATKKKYLGDITQQTKLGMENLKRAVESCGLTMNHIIKITLFLINENQLTEISEVYKQYFHGEPYPACSMIAVNSLPGGMGIEIEAIAGKY